ncbi:MAG TPA: RNA methyltransferase [Acholeplasmatales bacterium]|nr:MAG: N-6 DNA methylase [Tenericutes bacterium GWF2_57_13]HAQ56303.1 RNA methyltransferase [Acholeplasmatales bacterium]
MGHYELIATTTFGLETVAKRELTDLGFEIVKTENGKVTFRSDDAGIARANLWIRTADRILLKVGEFRAVTFDELFDGTAALPWEDLIPVDGKFPVDGKSIKSTLFSISDCQAIVKKAIVDRLRTRHAVTRFPETGADFPVLVSVLNDIATLTIDTSGTALHKRGYRVAPVIAPLKETLAAALVLLSYWRKDRVLYDVFCGSGTIPIEAAMIGKNIAPGLSRDFAFRHWPWLDPELWTEETRKAYLAIDHDTPLSIFASDLDEKAIAAAKENAAEAGVDDCIRFSTADYRDVLYQGDRGILISNPPYGERLAGDPDQTKLYQDMKAVFGPLANWSLYLLTSYPGFSTLMKRKPDRERKLYNGNIEVHYYQYYGPRP